MTREEVITRLKEIDIRDALQEDYDALYVAIEALEQEPCSDAISRQAVLDYIDEMPSDLTADGRRMIRRRTLEEYISDTLPPVTPQPKTGHWIEKDGREQGYDIGGIKTWYRQIICEKCGFIKTAIEGHIGQYHYCPNCGARMIKPQERGDKE